MPPGNDVVIVAYGRTPMGSFGGSLSEKPASELGSIVIKAVLDKLRGHLQPSEVDSVILGHVLTAGCGQSPVRQACQWAGLPACVPCSSVNKVCASGMKSVMNGAASILSGAEKICIVGGMESMSRVPFYLDSLRNGRRLGHDQVVDGLIKDGLWDIYSNDHMGGCTEQVNIRYNLTREMLDSIATESNRKAIAAYSSGFFEPEIIPVLTKTGIVTRDEQLDKVKLEKLPSLKPSFKPDGMNTPGNSSPISDGASALIIMNREEALIRTIKPIARIVAWADAARDPTEFTIAPALAVEKVLGKAKLSIGDIGVFEFNEAFATVIGANCKLLKMTETNRVNIFGGALSLGHPLGSSGCRIICTLITAMKHTGSRFGCAAICNGGGEASAIILELEPSGKL
jgi:acetyl-CoA C-acetyltransferase